MTKNILDLFFKNASYKPMYSQNFFFTFRNKGLILGYFATQNFLNSEKNKFVIKW